MDCEECSKEVEDSFISQESEVATVFWDSHGIIFINYLKKETKTGMNYVSLIDKLKVEIMKKRPHFMKKKVLFHQDNAPPHTSMVAMAKIHKLIDHPLYSPDLAPSNFFLDSKFGSEDRDFHHTNRSSHL